jgi:hypothetical protein
MVPARVPLAVFVSTVMNQPFSLQKKSLYQITPVPTSRSGKLLVAQLVKGLCYKPEGSEFDSQWFH